MAWKNIEQPFGGYNAVKMLQSGFDKLIAGLPLGLSDFDMDNTGDSIIVPPNGGYSDVSDDKVVIRVWNYLSQYNFMNYQTYWFNGSQWTVVGSTGSQAGTDTFKYFIVLDDSSHTACCGGIYTNGVNFKNVSGVWYDDLLQYMEPIVTYHWQSVSSISGKNGISLLSTIKSSAINGGDAVSGASVDAFDRLEETTKISTLIQGITEETPIIYSDDVNYMSITPTANNTCTLKFYLHGSVIYTLTDVSINAYLSFLIDETNGIMKPSIIYEDS